ncbi:MAG: Zn-ribbon containing protein [Candidatus Pacearchaeota archaeon]
MPHQCVHCSKIYPNASKELLEGCSCGSRFFFFISDEHLSKINENKSEINDIFNLSKSEKEKIERDAREFIGIYEEEIPVILDLESINVISPGKFEIDIVKLFNKQFPLIYKLENGKYIIDLASTFKNKSN